LKIPELQINTRDAIYKNYEKKSDQKGRKHLGASEIGHECDRYLWLSFRWAKLADFDGRMLRLFDSGNQQEPRLIADLRGIGVEVWDKDEKGYQWSYKSLGGHFAGSLDGVGLGLPEAPKTPHLLEFKTANAKSFSAMVKNGVKKSKPQHYVQMQVYMGWANLTRAMYLMVNKDTDEIHAERIEFDKDAFNLAIQRAERIITSPEPAVTLADDATNFTCKFCRFKDQCYGTEAPAVSCRTCAHSTPETDGEARWSCAQAKPDMDVAAQRAGCGEHRHIPTLLGRFAELMDATSNNLLTYRNKLTGAEFAQPVYTSLDITNLADKSLLGDFALTAIKTEFDCDITQSQTVDHFADLVDDLPWEKADKPTKAKKVTK
jgi:CRISPR/Cas system-associated exonuclease Cas4 (RecB family)